MKKLKALKGALIGVFVVAAACCVFAACSSDDDDDEVEVSYTPIDSSSIVDMKLDDSGVKKTYLTYQSFSSEGLEATATRESGAVEVMSASDLDIDYSAFDNTTAGEYTIKVSYVENGFDFTESYNVEVIEEITGLKVTKEKVDYVIGDSNGDGAVDEGNTATTATISLEDLKVYAVTAEEGESASETAYYDGDESENGGSLESGEYELKLFKGGDEITSLENVGVGIYTIYAYRSVDIVGKYSTIEYECGAYVLVYVVDAPVSIDLISEGATTSQIISAADTMTDTWAFTVTYESGNTNIVTIDAVDVDGLDTLSLSEGESSSVTKSATISYAENYITSQSHETKTVTASVPYTIESPDGVEIRGGSSDFESLRVLAVGESEKNTTGVNGNLKSEYFTGANSFIQYIGAEGTDSDQRSRYQSSTYIIETKGDVLAVTFAGTGKLTVEFSSNGSSSSSNLALKNEAGYYLRGTGNTATDDKLTEKELPDGEGYVYEVEGTTHKEISFIVNEPGTYIISTNVAVDGVAPGRPTRIKSIGQIDVVYETETLSALSSGLKEGAELADGGDFCGGLNGLDLNNVELALPGNMTLTNNENVLGKEKQSELG